MWEYFPRARTGSALYALAVWGLDLIARIVGSTQQYYHYDGLGSTRALTTATPGPAGATRHEVTAAPAFATRRVVPTGTVDFVTTTL